MCSERLDSIWILSELPSFIDSILDSIEGNITEGKLIDAILRGFTPIETESLSRDDTSETYISGSMGLPIALIPHKGPRYPGCPLIIFVVCISSNFGTRAIDAAYIAKKCQTKVQGVLFLTLSWNITLDSSIKQISEIMKGYGVRSVIRKEAVPRGPIVEY